MSNPAESALANSFTMRVRTSEGRSSAGPGSFVTMTVSTGRTLERRAETSCSEPELLLGLAQDALADGSP